MLLGCFLLSAFVTVAQQTFLINMAMIDGLPITPANVFNYQVQSSTTAKVQVKGTIRYRGTGLFATYSFPCTLRQGINMINTADVHPQWQFSSGALQELFFNYKMLPEGTYEYCVTVTPDGTREANDLFTECLYHRAADIFLLNLVYPEDKAKLNEFNPLLTWVANYPFASELTYKIRVAEMKQGQNPANAVLRNQPMLSEVNLSQNSIQYPVYARPLEVNTPYAWTVDAYYKGILLGSAEAWQFIIPDTIQKQILPDRSYIDICREHGNSHLTAIGKLKIKYVLEDNRSDVLSLELFNSSNEKCSFSPNTLSAQYGDNRYSIDLASTAHLKHEGLYTLRIHTKHNKEYQLLFQYLNPDYIR